MTVVQLGVGTHPARMDLLLHAGKPFEVDVPLHDAVGVSLDLTTWTVTPRVLSVDRQTLLGVLTVTRTTTGLVLSATADQTTAWAATWPTYTPWDLSAVALIGEPRFDVAGWISLYR